MIEYFIFCCIFAPLFITTYVFFKIGMYIGNLFITLLENSVYNIKNWMEEKGILQEEQIKLDNTL